MVKISSIFKAFLENTNFKSHYWFYLLFFFCIRSENQGVLFICSELILKYESAQTKLFSRLLAENPSGTGLKSILFQKLHWHFTVRINCSSDRKNFAEFRSSAFEFFLTVCQNNCRNKVPSIYDLNWQFLFIPFKSLLLPNWFFISWCSDMKNKSKVQVQVYKIMHMVSLEAIFSTRNILRLFKAT